MLKRFGKVLHFSLSVWGVALVLSNSGVTAQELGKTTSTTLSISNTEINPNLPEPIPSRSEIREEAIAVFSPSTFPSVIELADQIALDEEITSVAQSIDEFQLTSPEDTIEQITSVSQLADVQPTDWAFQALHSLVERYGCIQGYSDQTYRGDRTITRYEFAAGLNACLEQINLFIQSRRGEVITQDDLATLQRLQTEFTAELANLPQQLDNVETSINQLERQRFSTTTVLNGEVLFAVSGVGGEDVNGDDIDTNIILSDRAELNLSTSFFGSDLLRARLAASNTPNFADVTGTNLSKLSFTGDNNNDIQLGALFYRFPVGERAVVVVGTNGVGFGDFTPTLNPYINNSLLGNVGNFSGESAIYALNGGSGIGLEYRFSRAVRLSVGYLPSNSNNPESGLFSGAYGAIAQLTLLPTPNLSLGLTYVHSYNLIGTGKGSRNAEDPFNGAATSTNSYGLEASYQVSPNFNISGWLGLINAEAESNPNKGSDATIFTWAITFALPDLGKQGNLAGFAIGQPPKVIENDVNLREDPDTSLHLEAFYRYQITDNIAITPGFFLITNPEHNGDNDLIYVGTIRTSFVF